MSETKTLQIRMTESEKQELKRDAHQHYMNVSDYIKFLISEERKKKHDDLH